MALAGGRCTLVRWERRPSLGSRYGPLQLADLALVRKQMWPSSETQLALMSQFLFSVEAPIGYSQWPLKSVAPPKNRTGSAPGFKPRSSFENISMSLV